MAQQHNPYADRWATFAEQTKDHVLTIEHEAGLFRQLRVGTPGTGMWSWQVITWPGYLAIVGDIANGYTFARTTDMLSFFSSGSRSRYTDGCPIVDVRYWAEKIQGPARESTKVFSATKFMDWVRAGMDASEDVGTEVLKELRYELDPSDPEFSKGLQAEIDQIEARRAYLLRQAEEVSHHKESAVGWVYTEEIPELGDAFEVELMDWDTHFLFAAWAIELTTRLWYEHVQAHGTQDGFSVVDGGVVQNRTGLPVYNLDVLDANFGDPEWVAEVMDLFYRMAADPDRAAVQPWLDKVIATLRKYGSPDDLALVDKVLQRRGSYE